MGAISTLFSTCRTNRPANHLTSAGSKTTRAIAAISAAGLVFASAGLGAIYAWSTGLQHGAAMAGLMVLMAASLECAKPLAVAAALGGRELAAIAGAILAARRHHIPVLLDGFVATAAVVPLARLQAGILDHCRAGHVSAESGHRALLGELGLDPLLDLNMRLGEASGAGVAILLLRAALACHGGMATFSEAGVSGAGK